MTLFSSSTAKMSSVERSLQVPLYSTMSRGSDFQAVATPCGGVMMQVNVSLRVLAMILGSKGREAWAVATPRGGLMIQVFKPMHPALKCQALYHNQRAGVGCPGCSHARPWAWD